MDTTQEEQDFAIKTLGNLVKENQKLRGELYKAQEFCLRLLLANNLSKTDRKLSFTDKPLIDYIEDWEKILPYFFFNFYPNTNCNINIEDGTYQSDFSITIKDGTPFPSIGTIQQVREKVLELSIHFESCINQIS